MSGLRWLQNSGIWITLSLNPFNSYKWAWIPSIRREHSMYDERDWNLTIHWLGVEVAILLDDGRW